MKNRLTHLNHHDRLLIVLHEIYGINKHMEAVCDYYSQQGFDIACPDLLARDVPFSYGEEGEAYGHFMQERGFAAASLEVRNLIRELKPDYRLIFMLGFSIGATIAWICSEGNQECAGIIGYYGSRIRDYLNINPDPPVLLIYGDQESFGLEKLTSKVKTKEKATVSVLPGKHGFADPYTENYCEESAQTALKKTSEFLKIYSAKASFGNFNIQD